MNNTTAIYKIYFNVKPDLIYIGSAINFNLRKIRHKHQLKKGIHKNLYLQRLYNKYGATCLQFEVIENINNPAELIAREQYFIDLLKPEINVLKTAGSALGYKHSLDSKKKISKANKGRKMTDEQIKKGVLARVGQKTCKGCKKSESFKKHLSELKKRKVIDIETGEKFNSIGDAAMSIGVKYQTLYAQLSNRNNNTTDLRFL